MNKVKEQGNLKFKKGEKTKTKTKTEKEIIAPITN